MKKGLLKMDLKFYDEMQGVDGSIRPHYKAYGDWLAEMPKDKIAQKRAEADALFHRNGITFAVYGEKTNTERLIPFDVIPRVIPTHEWEMLEKA